MANLKNLVIAVIIILLGISCTKNENKLSEPKAENSLEYSEKKTPEKAKEETLPAQSKIEITEAKLQKVRELRETLERKIVKLDNSISTFQEKIGIFVNEIKDIRKTKNLVEYNEAVSNNEIKQNLQAIQKAEAYRDITKREKTKTQLAVVDLKGSEKQLDLDKTMFDTLPEAEIDKLLKEMDVVINRIQPTADDLVIVDKETVLSPLDKIYENHIRKEEKEQEKKNLSVKKKMKLNTKKN